MKTCETCKYFEQDRQKRHVCKKWTVGLGCQLDAEGIWGDMNLEPPEGFGCTSHEESEDGQD